MTDSTMTFELTIDFAPSTDPNLRQQVKDALCGYGFDSFVDGSVDNLDIDVAWGGLSEEQFLDLSGGDSPISVYGFQRDPLEQLKSGLESQFADLTFVLREFETRLWKKVWEQSFSPIQTRRLYIRAPWHPLLSKDIEHPEREGTLKELVLEPGGAFGTGHHQSTRLCLDSLESIPPQDHGCVLDIGTGSGILAIAAAKLGHTDVWGCDLDPHACDVALENVTRNEVGNNVQIVTGSLEMWVNKNPEAKAYLVLCNILLAPLLELLPEIRKILLPGGRVILSGITQDQASELCDKAEGADLLFKGLRLMDGWSVVTVAAPYPDEQSLSVKDMMSLRRMMPI